jgi:AraC-like DNA-binding protein
MPLFMDFHKIENVTIDDVKAAHMADVAIQDKYGVKYHQFWVNQEAGTVFCLAEGPDKETVELVHRMAHGNLACALTEVESGFYKALMGGERHVVDYYGVVKNKDGAIDLGYRSILVASIRSSGLNEDSLLSIPAWAKEVASRKINEFNGREINAGTESIIAVFNDATDAVRCAAQFQTRLLETDQEPVIFRIGLSADQPVTREGDFFRKAIKLAHHLSETAQDNHVIVSSLAGKLSKEVTLRGNVRYMDEPEEQFLKKLFDIIEDNFSDKNFNIDSICRNIGISRPQLYRKMTSLTGRSPNDFLRDVRMERALSLLRRKAGNVSQVALDMGYANASYFAKCFAKKFGCTPSEITFA